MKAPSTNEPIAEAEKTRTRGRLFRKYVGLFLAVVCVALLTNGLSEIWFSYQEHKTFQEFAEECDRLAEEAETEEQHCILTEMAAAWRRVAKEYDREHLLDRDTA